MLSSLYTVEKHREALIWSFLVAASDINGDGAYTFDERIQMLTKIGGNLIENRIIVAEPTRPSTVAPQRLYESLRKAGIRTPLATRYSWTSANGYPYLGNTHSSLHPRLTGANPAFCKIPLARCFLAINFFSNDGNEMVSRIPSPHQLFVNMAFARPSCGDCLIAALLTACSESGLEAFLPNPTSFEERATTSKLAAQRTVTHIGGFDGKWADADTYSFRAVLGLQWRPRDFAVRLIQRYSYVLGTSIHPLSSAIKSSQKE